VDGSVLHTFGSGDSFAPRSWNAADGSALVDAETDMLIYPSENGAIYFIKLNSVFDPDEGTVTIAPSSPVKWRFSGKRSQSDGKYWLGMESSAAIWRGFLIISDNGGHLICLDINTLELVWVQDVLDDTNCTPVIGLEDGHPYVYISTSFHGGWRASTGSSATVPIWKIDAVNGEIVWQADYKCCTADGVSGGVQGTAALGTQGLSGLVYVPVARTPTVGAGVLAALDTDTGEVVWELRTNRYAWSSPVCVYDQDGNGYVIYCTSDGNMYLLDGRTGETRDSISLGGLIEASPAVYGNTVVIGTRELRTWGVKLT
jgi:outer membrane protein assembly factor BamB